MSTSTHYHINPTQYRKHVATLVMAAVYTLVAGVLAALAFSSGFSWVPFGVLAVAGLIGMLCLVAVDEIGDGLIYLLGLVVLAVVSAIIIAVLLYVLEPDPATQQLVWAGFGFAVATYSITAFVLAVIEEW